MEYQKLEKYSKKMSNMQNGKAFPSFLIFTLITISTLQLVNLTLFLSGVDFIFQQQLVTPPWGGSGEIETYLSITFILLAAPFTVMGAIKLGQKDKNMFWYLLVAYSFFMMNDILLGLWFDLTKYFIIICATGYQYYHWNNPNRKHGDSSHSLGWVKTFSIIIILAGISIGLGFAIDAIYWKPQGVEYIWAIPFLDATVMVFTVGGFFLLTKQYKEGYALFYLCNISAIVLYALLGNQWTLILITSIYMVIDLGGLLHWQYIYKKQFIPI